MELEVNIEKNKKLYWIKGIDLNVTKKTFKDCNIAKNFLRINILNNAHIEHH